MIRKILYTIILFISIISFASAQNNSAPSVVYRDAGFGNPIDPPFVLAGTFGEIRNNHFHTGIDISTGNATGKPVYAAGDGYVSRIKVSATGFGKAIYITHPNGFVTVYAHLNNFSEPIEKYIAKIQYKKESFEADESLESGKLKVKKGSIIALSGNSGASIGPHLHFEIRDERTEEPINPLLFGYVVADNVKPAIKSVRFSPVPGQGIVVDSDKPRSYNVVQSEAGLSIPVSDYIQVFGKIGFEFSLTDYQAKGGSPLGIYSIQLAIDTMQVFSMKYDRLNFKDSRYVNAHIDYEAKYDDEGIFERCFRLSGDKLKIYDDTSSTGYFEFQEDGVHDVSLSVKDFNGNTSELNFQLLSYSSLAGGQYTEQPEDYFAMFPDKGLAIHKSDVEIIIPANAIYEVLLFTNTQSAGKKGYFSPTYEIGNPRVPLHLPVTLSIRPQNLPDFLRTKAIIVSFDKKGKVTYEGNEWNNEFLSAKTSHFGLFAISADTIPPVISILKKPGEGNAASEIKIKITDDLSGIKSYRMLLNDKWFLADYDAKNNLLIANVRDIATGKSHKVEIIVTDMVGNSTSAITEVSIPGK